MSSTYPSDSSATSIPAGDAVTDHNRQIWDRCAPTYTTGFENLTGGATTPLLDLAGVGTDTELLDIGTGPATLIGPALDRGARITAIDLAPAMVEQARLRHPGTTIDIGDGLHLSRASVSLDAITIDFDAIELTGHTRPPVSLRPGSRYRISSPEP